MSHALADLWLFSDREPTCKVKGRDYPAGSPCIRRTAMGTWVARRLPHFGRHGNPLSSVIFNRGEAG